MRELRNVIERIMILNDVREISVEHLPEEIISKVAKTPTKSYLIKGFSIKLPDDGLDFNEFVGNAATELKKQIILQALEKTHGNRTKAARLLRLSRTALGRQLEKIRNAV